MKKKKDKNEPVHLKPDDIMPLANISSPESELLKKILGQMVENEKRRVRNEFLRMIFSFAAAILLLICAGLWLSRDVLRQIAAERARTEQSWIELIKSIPVGSEETAASIAEPVADTAEEHEPIRAAMPDETPALETEGDIQEKTSRTKPDEEPEPSYQRTLTIPIKGDIPLRAPIPSP